MANPAKNSPVAEQVKDFLTSDTTPVALKCAKVALAAADAAGGILAWQNPKRWCRLVRSILGSSNAWKYSTKGAPIASTITTPPQFRNHSYYFKQILNC